MVRRRMASPKPSSPVRSTGFRTSPQRTYQPAPAAASTLPKSPVPTSTPTPTMGAPASSGPGLMGQMAATAGGVAIGSAVGHAVGNMLTSGSGGSQEAAQVAPQPAMAQQAGQPVYNQEPCQFEWKQFIDCTQMQGDLSLCEKFNEDFKACRARLA